MNKTIKGYSTLVDGEFKASFTLNMPKGAEILTVQINQNSNTPNIYAVVDPTQEVEERHFELIPTEGVVYCDMGVERRYIGSYQYRLVLKSIVGHIFERIN